MVISCQGRCAIAANEKRRNTSDLAKPLIFISLPPCEDGVDYNKFQESPASFKYGVIFRKVVASGPAQGACFFPRINVAQYRMEAEGVVDAKRGENTSQARMGRGALVFGGYHLPSGQAQDGKATVQSGRGVDSTVRREQPRQAQDAETPKRLDQRCLSRIQMHRHHSETQHSELNCI
jgi:hypothetical protein